MERKERYVSSITVNRYLQDNYSVDIKDMSGQEVIERLFGGYHNDYYSEFRIIDDCWRPEARWWQRLNRFWAYPIFFVMAPFQYVIYGRTGFSDKTPFGYWMLKVTGYR